MKIDFSKVLKAVKTIFRDSFDLPKPEYATLFNNIYGRYNSLTSEELIALRLCKQLYGYAEPSAVKGCILGGAVGDALGYPVEFLTDGSIFKSYGENGITSYDLRRGVAYISDDTQMLLFTADGLLQADRQTSSPSCEVYVNYVYQAYLNWFYTQDDNYPPKAGTYISPLLNEKQLFDNRALGGTCLSALSSGVCGSLEKRINNSKGCGGIMRVAPVAVYFFQKQYSAKEVAVMCGKINAITHGHDLGIISCAYFGALIYYIFEGELLTRASYQAGELIKEIYAKNNQLEYFFALIDRAIELALPDEEESEDYLDDLDAIRELGEGWVAEETLAIALYCSLRYSNSFEKAIIASVNHSGDSDSTGAVTGNIMGAYLGYDAIPNEFKQNLELSSLIEEMGEKLQLHKLQK